MPDPRTDRIAREAARLLETGEAAGVREAIRSAAVALGCADAPRPAHGLVRRHAQALAMQALGREGYREGIERLWSDAEELMSAIEHALPDARTLLVGRAARGHVDGGVTLHVRVYTGAPIGAVAGALVELGCEEPSFETAETRFGRLDRIRFEDDGRKIVVTRCPADLWKGRAEAGLDLFTERRIETVTVEELRRRLA